MSHKLRNYFKQYMFDNNNVLEYRIQDNTNYIEKYPDQVNLNDTVFMYDPLVFIDDASRNIISSVSDGGTLSNIKRFELDVILIPINYMGKHVFPIMASGAGFGLELKKHNRHRVCPICQKIYPCKMSDLARNSKMTCGDESCKKKYEKFKRFIEPRECISCGNTFNALINNAIEREYKTLNNSFCTHECILNAIPDDGEYFFKHKHQKDRFEKGLDDNYMEFVNEEYNKEDGYHKLYHTFDEFMSVNLGICKDVYGNEYSVYELIK